MTQPTKHGFYWYSGDETIDGVSYWQPVRVDPKGPKDQEFKVWIFGWEGFELMDKLYGQWGPEIPFPWDDLP